MALCTLMEIYMTNYANFSGEPLPPETELNFAQAKLKRLEEKYIHTRSCVDKALKALEDDESKNDYAISFLYEALGRTRKL